MKKLSKVLSLALAGVLVASSAIIPASAATKPAKVSNLQVTSTDNDEINLKWSKVSGATGYQIYVKKGNGNWKFAESTKQLKEDVDDLKEATTYSVKVRAYKTTSKGKVYGNFSNVITTTTDPDEVERLTIKKISSSKAKLTWKAVPNADGYRVYKYNTKTSKWESVGTTKTFSKTVTVSTKGGERFRVRAYVILNEKKYYGDASDSVKYTTSSTSKTQITSGKAGNIALNDAGVTKVYDYEVEKEKKNGSYVYEVSFETKNYEYEYVIDAYTGDILSKEKERNR